MSFSGAAAFYRSAAYDNDLINLQERITNLPTALQVRIERVYYG
jgi:hypothetical protein